MKDENKIPPHEKLTHQQLEDYLNNLVDKLTGNNKYSSTMSMYWFDPEKVNITKPFVKAVKIEKELDPADWAKVKLRGWDSDEEKSTQALKNLAEKFKEAGKKSTNTQEYYKGKDSLYKFAEEWGLNTYEFDILKRVVRCRHKGHFREDLQKTKELIEIYLAEWK